MESYRTEEDQVEAIRRFFAENGKAIITGIVIGVSGLVGWKYWNHHQLTSMTESSVGYQTIVTQIESTQTGNSSAVEAFVKDNNNVYGLFTSLQLAHHFATLEDFTKVEEQLQQALQQAEEENLRSVIALRLARIQIQNKQADAALKTLEQVKSKGWQSIVEELRGDIMLSKGDTKAARDAYSKGIESDASQAQQALLRIKLNNLSS